MKAFEAKRLARCTACNDPFKWDDQVILVDAEVYHKNCVNLYPNGYVAFLDENYIGETENEDWTTAFEMLQKGQYIEYEKDQS